MVASSTQFLKKVKLNGSKGEDDVEIVHPDTVFDAKTKGIERFLVLRWNGAFLAQAGLAVTVSPIVQEGFALN